MSQLERAAVAVQPSSAAQGVVALPIGQKGEPEIWRRAGPGDRDALTPAGLQRPRALARRRLFVAALNIGTLALLGWGIATALGAGGWSVPDWMILVCFLVGAPWTVLGMWNAVIGLWLLHGRLDGIEAVAPFLAAGERTGPLTTRTALAMTVRNEPPVRSYRRLAEMRRALDATGQGRHFDIAILSDTTDPEIAAEEERLFHLMRGELGGPARALPAADRQHRLEGRQCPRVPDGAGAATYDFYLPLDSDSFMGADTILRTGADHGGASADRHPADHVGGHGLVEPVHAGADVRGARGDARAL